MGFGVWGLGFTATPNNLPFNRTSVRKEIIRRILKRIFRVSVGLRFKGDEKRLKTGGEKTFPRFGGLPLQVFYCWGLWLRGAVFRLGIRCPKEPPIHRKQ